MALINRIPGFETATVPDGVPSHEEVMRIREAEFETMVDGMLTDISTAKDDRADAYMWNCVMARDIDGEMCVWELDKLGTLIILMTRHDFPAGPTGDEMWYRVTMGLRTLSVGE